MQIFPTRMHNVTASIALVGGGGGGAEREVCILRSPEIVASPISLWAELNGGENSLHWKANMLPLLSS